MGGRALPRDLVAGGWPGLATEAEPEVLQLQKFVSRLLSRTEGLSTREIARRCGLSHVSLKRIFDGDAWPDSWSITLLERAFGPLWGATPEGAQAGAAVPAELGDRLDPVVLRSLTALGLACHVPKYSFQPEMSAEAPGLWAPTTTVDLFAREIPLAVNAVSFAQTPTSEEFAAGVFEASGRLVAFRERMQFDMTLAILLSGDAGRLWDEWARNRRIALLYPHERGVVSSDEHFPDLPRADVPIGIFSRIHTPSDRESGDAKHKIVTRIPPKWDFFPPTRDLPSPAATDTPAAAAGASERPETATSGRLPARPPKTDANPL